MARTGGEAMRARRPAAGHSATTKGVPERERVDYWRDVVSAAFVPVDVHRMCDAPFRSALQAERLGAVTVTRVRSTAVGISRTAVHVAADPGDVMFVNMADGATRTVTQGQRVEVAGSGDVVLLDGSVPFAQNFSAPFGHLSFMVPRELLEARVAVSRMAAVTRIPGDSGVGGVLAATLRGLGDHAAAIDAAAARGLADQLVELLALAVGRAGGISKAPPRALLLQAALDAVEVRLRDPDLTPAAVARHLCVSVRSLHGLFADHGTTFGRWVLRRRLEHCHRDLLDPAHSHRAVGEVATAWGFRDASHFSRTFRGRYGVSPREHRRAHGG